MPKGSGLLSVCAPTPTLICAPENGLGPIGWKAEPGNGVPSRLTEPACVAAVAATTLMKFVGKLLVGVSIV